MTREWKVGDRVRDTVRERDGVVVAARSDAIDVKLGHEFWTWILPTPAALVHIEREVEPSIFPQVKVEVGGETVLNTTVKRSRTIRAMEYLIHNPEDAINCASNLRIWITADVATKPAIVVERVSDSVEVEYDLEELELLLEVAKKLLQKG